MKAAKVHWRFPLMIVLGATFYGFITVGGKYFSLQEWSLYEISLLICFIPPALLPFMLWKRVFPSWGQVPFFVVFGIIGAALQITQFAGLVLGVPVAIVALLLYTQPIWTVLLARAFLDERLTGRKLAAVLLAFLGILILTEPWASLGRFSVTGLLSALAAGLFLSLWVIWGRRSGLRDQHFLVTTFGYTSFSGLCLLMCYPLFQWLLESPALARFEPSVYLEHWPEVGAYTVLAGILPACLAFAGMVRVEAARAGVLLLMEPVSAAVLAGLLLGEPVTRTVLAGGALILAANYLMLRGDKQG